MDFQDTVANLLAESQALLKSPVGEKGPKFILRRSAMYQLCSSQETILTPAVHLWEPDRDTLIRTVLQWEPNLKGESFWVAVHGHSPSELCGGKAQRIQLCHMAFFKPTGVEKENFDKKWRNLYADEDSESSSPPSRDFDAPVDESGGRGIQFGGVGFVV